MCGIAGFLDPSARESADSLAATARAMAVPLRHRGPDDEGAWVDPAAGIAFGHRRLSIIDLSPSGAQPMHSASGRYVVTYNGELYNAPALSRELEARGARFRGHCDTEVLLAAIEAWGPERALRRTNGMFAFALWDRELRHLHLVRDRLGEKPLYYGWCGNVLLFGSELAALRAHPSFRPEVDREAIAMLLRSQCIPAPHSIFQGVRKLLPGTMLTVRSGDTTKSSSPQPFWSPLTTFEQPSGMSGQPESVVIDALDELLRDATNLRMRSDVPLGAFLSGGVDSSAVVALMQAQATSTVRTFTIGSQGSGFDEAPFAKKVADYLGTSHTTLEVTPEDALALVPSLPTIYDEPFGDSSQLPTLLVAELARRDVTVSLSGDGGDEVFGGYERYRWVPRLARRLRRVPRRVRRLTARLARAVPPRTWDYLTRPVPRHLRPRIPATKVEKFAQVCELDEPKEMYERLVAHWDRPETVVIGASGAPTDSSGAVWPDLDDTNAMMVTDLATYLPDDILVKVDRATMRVGLEGRMPFLDHRVVEFMAALPADMKVRGRTGKWLLRQLLHRYIPEALIKRPKTGFGLPVGDWLRGPLRPWAEELLDARRIGRDGYLRADPIRARWEAHLRGARDHEYELWGVLMFQAWLETVGAGA